MHKHEDCLKNKLLRILQYPQLKYNHCSYHISFWHEYTFQEFFNLA